MQSGHVPVTEPGIQPRWVRILLAAVRLAAVYAAGVLILLIPLFLCARRWDFDVSTEAWLALPLTGVFCFVLGFVALAAVKRLGFALLWGLLVWWWIAMVRNSPAVVFLDTPFLAWSAFAAPLYALSAVGLSSETSSRRWHFEAGFTLLVWAIIALLAFFFAQPPGVVLRIRDTPFQYTGTVRGYVYVSWPFVIGGRELARVFLTLWRSRKPTPREIDA